MVTFVEFDPQVSVFRQMDDESGGPVVLINRFDIAPEDVERFLAAWGTDANLMKRQPGFISTQLHRGIGGSTVFVNYAVWESPAHFKRAFRNPEFQSGLKNYPSSAVTSPHLFRKVAIDGVCVA
jgi:heme-degrading monooxygenase HmoA